MKIPLALGLIVGFLLTAILIGRFALSRPSVRQAILMSPPVHPVVMQTLGNYTDTDSHAKYFLLLIRQHQYAAAHSLMTPAAEKQVSAPALQNQWAAFEGIHGRVTRWTEAGGTTNLLPEYVDRRYSVSGSGGSAGVVTLRMTRPAGSPTTGSPYALGAWQVASLTFSR